MRFLHSSTACGCFRYLDMTLNHMNRLFRWALVVMVVFCFPCLVAATDLARLEDPEVGECADIWRVPVDSRCSYLKENCLEDVNADAKDRLRYLSLLYCRFLFLGSGAILPIILFLILCFTLVGTIASDFLCPNLYTISKILQLSDRLAGLTFLALGNGAPDVLGTYKAMSMNTESLAVSELVGAAFFATTIVVGLIAVVHPFQVKRGSFIIDFGFFLLAATVVLIAIVRSTLSIWTSVSLCLIYLSYVLVLMVLHSMWKSRAERQIRERRARSNFDFGNELQNLATDEVFLDTFATLPTIEELILHEHHTMEHPDANNMTLETGSYGLKVLLKDLSKHSRTRTGHGIISLDHSYERPLSAPELAQSDHQLVNAPHTYPMESHLIPPDHPNEDEVNTISSGDDIRSLFSANSFIHYSPAFLEYVWKVLPEVDDYQEMGILQRCHLYITYPLTILLNLTTPTVNYSSILLYRRGVEVDDEDAFLTLFQCFVATNFVTYIIARSLDHYWLTTVGILAISSAIVLLVALFALAVPSCKHYIKMTGSLFGFVSSICWIALFATEIISIFQAIATSYNLSDDILGLTVFAWGNSVGDLISNFTIARMGLPLMAFGACFGAPLLSLCLLGISTILVNAQLEHTTFSLNYDIETTITVKIMAMSVILNMFMLFTIVRFNGWMVDKKVGTSLITSWFLTVIVCITTEFYN